MGEDSPGHEVPEHEAPEHEAPEHEVPEHKAPEHEAPEHKAPERPAQGPEVPEREVPEREVPEREVPERDVPGAVAVEARRSERTERERDPTPDRLRYMSPRDAGGQGPGEVPAYQVAARMLAQGLLSGVAGAVPMTSFLFVAMALDGVGAPELVQFVAGYLFFAAMISAWGAALTAVEEFARRADRSLRRMVVASLAFPLFAIVVTAWIGGVVDGGARGGLRTVRMILADFWREFQRHPGPILAIAAAFVVPFLGLILVRRRHREHEGPLRSLNHYLASGALGLGSATCVLVANLLWENPLKSPIVLLGFAATGILLVTVSWGLASGRAVSDYYVRRYQRWAYAD